MLREKLQIVAKSKVRVSHQGLWDIGFKAVVDRTDEERLESSLDFFVGGGIPQPADVISLLENDDFAKVLFS